MHFKGHALVSVVAPLQPHIFVSMLLALYCFFKFFRLYWNVFVETHWGRISTDFWSILLCAYYAQALNFQLHLFVHRREGI